MYSKALEVQPPSKMVLTTPCSKAKDESVYLKKNFIYFLKKTFLVFPEIEPCIFQLKLKMQKNNPLQKQLFCFWEMELFGYNTKKFLMFQKMEFS